MSGLGAFAGGLASGYIAGTNMQDQQEDRAWQREQRNRTRRDWADEDAVREAHSAASQPGLDAVPAGQLGDGQDTGQPGAAARPDAILSRAQRVLKSLEAGMDAAAKRGNTKLFATEFQKAAEMRAWLREQTMERADAEFDRSGDYNAYLPAYNLVEDGRTLHKIERQQDGSFVLRGSGADGKHFERQIKDEPALRGLIERMRDRKAVRSAEAQRAFELYKSDLKIREHNANKATDLTFEIGKHDATFKPQVVTRKMGEGEPESVGLTTRQGGIDWQAGGDTGSARPLDLKTTAAIRSALGALYKISDMNSMDPATQTKLNHATRYASLLLQANQGTEAGQRLDVNTAAGIASDIAEGKVDEARWKDKAGQEWRGVNVNGVKYLLDPHPVQAVAKPAGHKPQAGLDSVQGAGTRQVSGKIGQPADMKIDPKVQAQRNADALQILRQELNDTTMPPASRAALEKEYQHRFGMAAPSVQAIAYLRAHAQDPSVRAQFQQKFGYLPEGL